MTVLGKPFTMRANQSLAINFSVPAKCSNVRVQGNFEVTGGKDLLVFLVDEDNLANFVNKQAADVLYSSGPSTQSTLDLRLPPDQKKYYVVFDSSLCRSTLTVNSSVKLVCDRLP